MKVLVIAGSEASLVNFRGPLLSALAAKHELHVAAPNLRSKSASSANFLTNIGAISHDLFLRRTGLNPVEDLKTCKTLVGLMRDIRPEVVLSYTIKPVVWGGVAAKIARVPRFFALITGLGYAFTGKPTGQRKVVQLTCSILYRIALHGAAGVFFQNDDDAGLFKRAGIVSNTTPVTVVDGSGVDVTHYDLREFPSGPISFLMIARLLGDKGVREYFRAAKQVRRRFPRVEFHLVGGLDSNPEALTDMEVRRRCTETGVCWHGELSDVRSAIEGSHVFVLPSYREGLPRSVLEAMSMGRPVITTRAPGCRQTVVEGRNGFLVEPRDANELAVAITKFVENPELIFRMGAESRRLATTRFESGRVCSVMMDTMRL